MNLAEFPLTVLSTRVNPDVKTLEFSDTQRLKDGEIVQRKWIITGADKFGLPTSTDDDVILGLIRLTVDRGFRERKIYFTRYELLKILRWTTEGRSYSRLTKSLDRLSGVRIRTTNGFYDNSLKAYQTRNFGIVDAYEINDGRGGKSGADAPLSYFIWSETLFDSFQAGFIKKLDLELYFVLKSAVSRRLYRFLDKHFYYTNAVEKPLALLAYEKLGLSRNYKYISSIKQQLEPAMKELIDCGFISEYSFNGRGEGTTVRFVAKKTDSAAPKATSANITLAAARPEPDPGVAGELMRRGLSESQVQRLLADRKQPELAQITAIIAYYDHLLKSGDPKVSRNSVGFLYRAVESPFKFSLPIDYQLSAKPTRSKRADLKIVRASDDNPQSAAPFWQTKAQTPPLDESAEKAQQKLYREFMLEQLKLYREQLNEEELKHFYHQAAQRLQPLRRVLDKVRFQQAVEKNFNDTLLKRLALPSYREWQESNESGADSCELLKG